MAALPAFDPGPAPAPTPAPPVPAAPAVPEVPEGLIAAPNAASEVEAVCDTAADIGAFGAWVRATFTPPDFWHQAGPSASEEWAYARAGVHLPEQGPWRSAAAAYGAAAAGAITVLLALVWVLRAPARAGVLALLVAAVSITVAVSF